ncbi:hypothetical protein ACFXG4_08540 [Nocardia sp. NPDC059246]|uniref:hypothetical protein n=1 Tax=unclassified Nocardia TaxID=2637762 RepID=UPI0036CDEE5E
METSTDDHDPQGGAVMGPYCRYCDMRCFVHDPKGSGFILATCDKGMANDRAKLGYDINQARAEAASLADAEQSHAGKAEDDSQARPAATHPLPKTLAALRQRDDQREVIGHLLDTDPLFVRDLLLQALDQLPPTAP